MKNVILTVVGIKSKRNIILWIQTIFTYIVVTSAAYLVLGTGSELTQLRHSSQQLYRLVDNFVGDSGSEFYGRYDNVEILQELNYWLNNHDEFLFMNLGRHHVGIGEADMLLPDRLTIEYEHGRAFYDGFRSYNSIQVGSRFLEHFSFEVEAGRLFEPADFDMHNDVIPLLLGSEYRAYVGLGDTFEFWMVGYVFTGEVVGFLREGTYYNNSHDLIATDRFIVLPALVSDGLISSGDRTLALRTYLNHVSGLILSDLPNRTIQSLITQRSLELNITPFALERTMSLNLTMLGIDRGQLQATIMVVAMLMIIITCFSVSISMTTMINRFKRDIATVANGLSRIRLKRNIALSIIFINLISAVVSLFVLVLFSGNFYWLPLLIIVCVNVAVQCFHPLRLVNNLQISSTMNGK